MAYPHTRAWVDDLPTELLALIIFSLGPLRVRTPNGLSYSINESSSWTRCCLVSKRWRDITLPYLFKHLVVTDHLRLESLLELLKPKGARDGDTPAGDTPACRTPSGKTPAGDTPVGDTPPGDTPSGDTPAGDTLFRLANAIQTLSVCSHLLDSGTLFSILDLLPKLQCLDLDDSAFITTPHFAAAANPTSRPTKSDQKRVLQRLRYHGGSYSKPGDYTHILSFLAQHDIRMVDVLEIRGPFTQISSPSDNNLLHQNNPPSDLTMYTINELDVDVLPSAFISALELSNINRGMITSLRVCLAKHTELPCLGELIYIIGHNLGELSLDIRWAWTRYKTTTTLGVTSSGDDSLDICTAPAILVSETLQEGFTTLINLRKLRLTLLDRDLVYRNYIPNDPEGCVTMDEFERRVMLQAVYLIASIVELLPTPPPLSRDYTTDAQRPGLLTHFSAQIILTTWSTVPPSSFILIPSNFDWTVLQPAWTRLQSALDLHRDDYTSVCVSLTGRSEGDDVDEGQRGWRNVEERES